MESELKHFNLPLVVLSRDRSKEAYKLENV